MKIETTRHMRWIGGTAFCISISMLGTRLHADDERFEPSRGWYDGATGTRLLTESWRKADGPFGALLVLTKDDDQFVRDWTGMPESRAPQINKSQVIRRGEHISAIVMYSGCGVDRSQCDGVIDFMAYRPDGISYASIPKVTLADSHVRHKNTVYMAQGVPTINIERKDPDGLYKVVAIVRDIAASRSVTLQCEFVVSK